MDSRAYKKLYLVFWYISHRQIILLYLSVLGRMNKKKRGGGIMKHVQNDTVA